MNILSIYSEPKIYRQGSIGCYGVWSQICLQHCCGFVWSVEVHFVELDCLLLPICQLLIIHVIGVCNIANYIYLLRRFLRICFCLNKRLIFICIHANYFKMSLNHQSIWHNLFITTPKKTKQFYAINTQCISIISALFSLPFSFSIFFST
jgi:hypothetical protein